jgi:hypothetical protein
MKLITDNLSLFSDSDGYLERLPTNTLSHNYRIQRWANFIAGYSIEFVEACLSDQEPSENVVLDPFLGCGTTLVAAKNMGFHGIGYEAHPIFYTLAQAKLKNYARYDISEIAHKLLTETVPITWSMDAQKFIAKMYSEANREAISRAATAVNSTPASYKPYAVALFLKACEMACQAQTDGIYKAPDSKKNSISFQSAVELAVSLFKEDIESDWYTTHWVNQPIPHCHLKSAESMAELENNSIGICITSPPYLNNFDFAEMTRLHLYLLGWADSWKNITQLVRKNLITNTADIPIIALTTSVALNERPKIEAHGFDGLLAKPINISELLSELSHYLKYTKKAVADAPQVTTTAVDNTLNPEEIADLPALRNELQQEMIPLWKKANIIMEMDIVAKLAEKMVGLGNEYNIPIFIHYGEPLLESTQIFDIAYIQKALKEFPVLVKPLIGNME